MSTNESYWIRYADEASLKAQLRSAVCATDKAACRLQEELGAQVEQQDAVNWYIPTPEAPEPSSGDVVLRYVGGLDVSFSDEEQAGCGFNLPRTRATNRCAPFSLPHDLKAFRRLSCFVC